MNKSFINLIRATAIMAGLAMLIAGKNAGATTHVVKFGGSLGDVFSPKSFTATVGDTVMWEGDFSIHTTTSTSVPSGAATWSFGPVSATSFSYVIKVAGTYDYQCNVHVSLDMVGSFEASASSVMNDPFIAPKQGVVEFDVATIVLQGKPMIRLNLPSTQFVNLQVFDLRGNIVSTLFHRMVEAGTHLVAIDNRFQTDGFYIVRLSGKGPGSSRTLHFIE
jgi:plastocyanin